MMPKKIRQLIDSHGAGIPHQSFEGGYMINVYPEQIQTGEEGHLWWRHPTYEWRKVVNIWNRKTGEHWREIIND